MRDLLASKKSARSTLLLQSVAAAMVDTDAALEEMTSSLLQVSTVFLVQQNELQAVRDRLARELKRVDEIQESLTMAAQQHQDAVLTVIQNYESLAVAHEAALEAARAAGAAAPALNDGVSPAPRLSADVMRLWV